MTTQNINSVRISTDNAAVVRRAYGAFNTGDMQVLAETLDETASWHTPGESALSGEHAGRDATFAQFGRYVGDTNHTFKADLRQLFAGADGRVVGLHHNSGERNGKKLDVDCCITFIVRDGRIVEGRESFADLSAWDAFWA